MLQILENTMQNNRTLSTSSIAFSNELKANCSKAHSPQEFFFDESLYTIVEDDSERIKAVMYRAFRRGMTSGMPT